MPSCKTIAFSQPKSEPLPANILNRPAYTVISLEENDHDYHISAETKQPPLQCQLCQSDNLVGFGRREQMVRDLPMHGRRVGLYINARRFQCRACSQPVYEALPAAAHH